MMQPIVMVKNKCKLCIRVNISYLLGVRVNIYKKMG